MKFGLRPYLNRFLNWLTIGKVGIILLLLSIPGIMLNYRQERGSLFDFDLLEFSYNQFSWEIASIAFTVLIIDRLYRVQEIRNEKKLLIRQLRSSDASLVREAADRLRTQGWLADGTLRGANLHGIVLRDVDWQSVDLTHAILDQADLRSTDLRHADLSHAQMSGANLNTACLNGAIVSEKQLQNASQLAHAILPNGIKYDGRYQLPGDIYEARKNGYNPEDVVSMARFYDATIKISEKS